jgi:hypothetical protein
MRFLIFKQITPNFKRVLQKYLHEEEFLLMKSPMLTHAESAKTNTMPQKKVFCLNIINRATIEQNVIKEHQQQKQEKLKQTNAKTVTSAMLHINNSTGSTNRPRAESVSQR